jgi:hypothetical protein
MANRRQSGSATPAPRFTKSLRKDGCQTWLTPEGKKIVIANQFAALGPALEFSRNNPLSYNTAQSLI